MTKQVHRVTEPTHKRSLVLDAQQEENSIKAA